MHAFRVWAPLPKKVEVQVDGQVFPATPNPDGWWTVEIADARPASDYGWLLDGAGPFPDPRSPSQPNGVHGLSRLVDQNDFQWTDARWQAPPLSSAIIYELHIGTFTPEGTFAAVIAKLDHLLSLGVTHVELMPVNEFSGQRGWGYDGVDLFAPHASYGSPRDLKTLVDACHQRGLAVILDVVYNHLGPSGNYLPKFAPYFTNNHASAWGAGINFDGPDSEEVRRFFCDNALMWLRDYHFDGLRLDAVHAIIDHSAHPFLEQLGEEVRQLAASLGRHLVLILESDLNDPRLLWSRERGGFALDAQWSDDFHHALHTVLTRETTGYYADFGTLANLAKSLQQAFVYDGCFSPHRRRRHGRKPEGLSGHRFLGYLQNHDQIGNRARGDRASQILTLGRLKIGAALVLTSPFVPMLFQGEEWGALTPFLYFTDHSEPELAEAVRTGRCCEFAAFGWKPEDLSDPQAEKTFLRSKLNWLEPSAPPHAELLNWHRQLIHLRQTEPALNDGRMECVQTRYSETEGWFSVERGNISVVCNLGASHRQIPLSKGKHKVMLSSEPLTIMDNEADLAPESVGVFKLD